jgi:hypothetical protein
MPGSTKILAPYPRCTIGATCRARHPTRATDKPSSLVEGTSNAKGLQRLDGTSGSAQSGFG